MPYKNKEKSKQYQRDWYSRNKEKVKVYQQRWEEKNKEKLPMLRKKWRDKWRKCIACKKDIFGSHRMKYCKDCHKEKMGKVFQGNQYWKLVKHRLKGKENPNWRGGITFWRKRIWDSPKYQQWRTAVFIRDNWTCQKCGAKNGNGKTIRFEAHHCRITFADLLEKYHIHSREGADKCNEFWKIDLGQTLCFKCHQPTKNGNPRKKRK